MSNLPSEIVPIKPAPKAGLAGPGTAPPRKRRTGLWIVLTLVVAAIVGIAVYSHRSGAQRAGAGARPGGRRAGGGGPGGFGMNGPTPVVVTRAVKGDINVILDGLGTVTPLATVTIHTQINGQLVKVNFVEGQMVKQGDVLAIIDPRPYDAALNQAKGQLLQAQAQLKEAQIDLERYVTLSGQDSISKQQVDAQRALVLQYDGLAKTDQAAVDSAQVNLNYCTITAPVGGRIGLRLVDQGNYVTPGDATGIALLTQMTPMTVIFSLPEDYIPAVEKRIHAVAKDPKDKIVVEAFDRSASTELASGMLTTIDNTVDTTTGQFKLRATFPNADEALFPNQFVNVKMFLSVDQGVTVIPTSAIERGQQGTYVYVVKEPDEDDDDDAAPAKPAAAPAAPSGGGGWGGASAGGGAWGGAAAGGTTVAAQTVVLGDTEGEKVAVISGITPGQQVVVDGADRLKDGMAVLVQVPRVAKPEGAKPSGAPTGRPKRRGEQVSGK